MTVNSTPSAVLRTIIKDFEIRNRKSLTRITDGDANDSGSWEESEIF